MAKRRSNDLARARAEAAALLRLDPEHLSPADVLRCDIVASLRLVIDSAHADVLDGTQTDLGKLLVAVETLTKLLPSVDVKTGSTASATTARERLWVLVSNAIAADQIEKGQAEFENDQVEASALQAAQEHIALLQDEIAHLRGSRPRRLPPPSDKPVAKKSDAAVVAKSAPKQPADWDPIVNGLWRPPVAGELVSREASPSPSAAPPPSPPPPQNWDSSPGGKAWHQWANSGGYSNDGLAAAGWISRLNARAW
jgi:hypothetical protein